MLFSVKEKIYVLKNALFDKKVIEDYFKIWEDTYNFIFMNIHSNLLKLHDKNILILSYNMNSYINILKELNNNNNVIILNTEQNTIKYYKNQNQLLLDNNFKMLDYSMVNIKLLNNTKNYKHFPYQFSCEIDKINYYLKTEPKEYDFAFVGNLSPYRKMYLNTLALNKFKVKHIEGFLDERDRDIAKCRVLLNIHNDENYKIYEHLRCDRWEMAGHLILSEESLEQEKLSNKIIFFNKNNFIDKVNEILKINNTYEVYKKPTQDLNILTKPL
jgi:hypothetical protein